jgi:hypothetical protein
MVTDERGYSNINCTLLSQNMVMQYFITVASILWSWNKYLIARIRLIQKLTSPLPFLLIKVFLVMYTFYFSEL